VGRPPTVAGEPGSVLSVNLKYFAFRAVVFGALLAGSLVLLGDRWVLALALAVVFSGLASYPLARRGRRAIVAAADARRSGLR
jgi:hypothetical protein